MKMHTSDASRSVAAVPASGTRRKRFLAIAVLGAGLAPLATLAGSSVAPVSPAAATTSAVACATAKTVFDASDITYLGAVRMPATGVDTSYAYGGLAGRIVNGHVRLFLYGNNVAAPKDAVYEIEEPGSGYDPNYAQAPRASLVTAWGDVYHGKRQSWDSNGAAVNLQYVYPDGLYWNEATQLLYWTYYDAYNVTHRPDWGLGATALTDPSNGASTAYGPWRTTVRDGDGTSYYGPWRCRYLWANPSDGSMMCGSTLMSGNSLSPWGPDAYGGHAWPTATTPGGYGTPDVSLPNRYLEHYFMGSTNSSNYVDSNGIVHGHLRAFRRTNSLPVWEDPASTAPALRANPGLNGGVSSWTDLDTVSAATWLELTNKRGVIFASTLVGSPTQNTSDCTNAAHEWYSNSGVHPPNGACSHGCAPPVAITGPVTTAAFPALIVYDPDQLLAIRNGSLADYSADPRSVIDLDQAYHIKTAAITTVGAGKTIRGMYFDPIRKYLFVLAAQADDSTPGIFQSLIHVFAIRD